MGQPAGVSARNHALASGDFRQVIGQHIDPAVHKDALHDVSRPLISGVAANEIGQQIAGKGAIGEMSKMQVREKIHINFILQTASLLAVELLVSSMRLARLSRRLRGVQICSADLSLPLIAVSMHLE